VSKQGKRRHVAVLDNEAAQAVADAANPKHWRMAELLSDVWQRRARHESCDVVFVSTAARVLAGGSRQDPGAAELGRLNVRDVSLDAARADTCAALVWAGRGTAVDATVAQVALEQRDSGATVSIYTADVADLRRLVGAGGGVAVYRV
jgi:hypothetical protein